MFVIFDHSQNPYFNLASEEYLLTNEEMTQPVIRIWQNSPAIIVGKFQNTLAEINQKYVEEKSIAVVRRITGGGAVYHDLGNINYTIAQPAKSKIIDFTQFTKPIIELLASYGVQAQNKGRNDIEINGCKISGGAQTIHKNRVLHHGTLLFDVKLDAVAKALQPKQAKLAAKGVQSIRARVANITDFMPKPVSVEKFMQDMKNFFLQQPESTPYFFSDNDLRNIQKLLDEKYSKWEWNYGQSPDYNMERTRKYPWGELSILLLIKNDMLQSVKVYGDFFSAFEVQKEFDKLDKTAYQKDVLREKIAQTSICSTLPLEAEELLEHLID